MSVVRLVLAAGWRDLARSRWLIAYALGFFILGEGLFWFGGSGPQVVLSLLNIVLMVVPLVALVFGTIHVYASREFVELLLAQPVARAPLVALVFGTIHVYASREFVELLLAQPVARAPLFAGLYLGLALPLAGAFALGAGIPFVLHAGGGASAAALLTLAVAGVVLSLVFAGIASLIAWSTDDRLRGVGLALGVWLTVTILYDGGVLAATAAFADWPLERPLLAAMVFNPVDLGRLVVLSQLDASALMGYTGALFNRALGTSAGAAVAALALVAWCAIPFFLASRRFVRRDF
jgi:Cu-processing system permease protein